MEKKNHQNGICFHLSSMNATKAADIQKIKSEKNDYINNII